MKPQAFSLREGRWEPIFVDEKGESVRVTKEIACLQLRSRNHLIENPRVFTNLAEEINFHYDDCGPFWQVWRWDPLAEVRLQEGEPLENALRRFKRKVQQEDIIKEVKRHSYYLKPGEKRRVKAALARKRNRKKARKEQD